MRVLIVSRSGPSSHCGYILAIARFLVHQVKSELSFGLAQAGGARPLLPTPPLSTGLSVLGALAGDFSLLTT